MLKEGLHLLHGAGGKITCIISQNKGQELWMREFANAKSAIDILEDCDLMSEETIVEADNALQSRHGFFTAEYAENDEGYKGDAMWHFKRLTS